MDYLTTQGKETFKKAIKFGLAEYYDEFNGNFLFSDFDFEQKKLIVLRWLKENDDYCLFFSDGYWLLIPQDNL